MSSSALTVEESDAVSTYPLWRDVLRDGRPEPRPQDPGHGGDLVWCDARTTATGFYERMGFTVVAGPFDKPGIGPHVGMLVDLPA